MTWIPTQDVKRFIVETLSPSYYAAREIKVRFSNISGDWFIENKSADSMNIKANSTYGTERASAYRLLEDALNQFTSAVARWEIERKVPGSPRSDVVLPLAGWRGENGICEERFHELFGNLTFYANCL